MSVVYSSFEQNWRCLKLLIDQSYSYYQLTKNTDSRNEPMVIDGKLHFSLNGKSYLDNEENFIRMFLVWISITIESLINQIIADNSEKPSSILRYIEKPKREIKNKKGITPKTDLGYKLLLLDDTLADDHFVNIADEIAMTRNQIVHDKPYIVIEDEDYFDISYISSYEIKNPSYRYDQISETVKKFDILLIKIISIYKDKIMIFNDEAYSLIDLLNPL